MEDATDGEVGRGLSAWTACAAESVARMGPRVIPDLVGALDSSDDSLVDGAAVALADLGDPARTAVPTLIETCDRDPKSWACWALGRLADPRGIDVLVAHLDDGTETFLESMADQAAEPVVDRMVAPDATYQTLIRGVDALEKTKHPPARAFEKLRAALHSALAAPLLRLPEDCPEEACHPKIVWLMDAIALWKRDALPAKPDLLRAWHSKDPEVARAARSALAAAGAGEIVPALAAAIAQGDVWLASADLSRLGPDATPAIAAIERQLALNEVWFDRSPLLDALGAIGGESAVRILRAELTRPIGDPSNAARALARIGAPGATPAISDLQTLATTHWDILVRREAARAVSTISGQSFEPKPIRCPAVRASGSSIRVDLVARSVAFQPTGRQRAQSARCRGLHDAREAIASFDDGTRCLLSQSRGEFGGWIEVFDSSRSAPYAISDAQALDFVRLGSRLLVVNGLAHMGGSGWITELWRRRDGVLEQRHISAEMMNVPIATMLDAQRHLVLLVERSGMSLATDCANVVVRLDDDGSLHLVE